MSITDMEEFLFNSTFPSIASPTVKNPSFTFYFLPFYAVLFFCGSFGNGLVIISIFRSSRLRTVTNTYLLNIAVADFLLLLSIPFLIITLLANGWIFGHVLCKMYYNFIHINQYVSSLLLAALSFDRYLAVCHPIRAIEFRTKNKSVLIIAGCWLISVLFLCPTWVFAGVTSDRYVFWLGYRVERCVIDFPAIVFTIPPEIVFTYYAFLLGFLVPGSMITIFYVLVLLRLHQIGRKHRSGMKQRSHRKVTRVVLAVITAYFICWIPYWLLQIFITIDPLIHSLQWNFSILPAHTNMRFLKELSHLTTIIGYSNNCLNPVLYVFFSESFREEYLVLLKCFRGKSTNPSLRPVQSDFEASHHSQVKAKKKQERKSMLDRKRRDQAMKKAKHSVAMDDVPLGARCSSSFRSNRQQGEGSTSSKTKTNQQENLNHFELVSLPAKVSLSLRRTISSSENSLDPSMLDSKPSSPMPIDDGGVYCGN